MPTGTRKPPRIPEPFPACELYNAVYELFDEPQTHFVAFPFKSGPQPCVTKHLRPDGIEEVAVNLVVIPWDAPHASSSKDDLVVGTLLSLYKHIYRGRITEAKQSDAVNNLTGKSYNDSPYQNFRLHHLLSKIDEFALIAASSKVPLPTPISQAVSKLKRYAKHLKESWEPPVFFNPPHGDYVKYRKDQWLVEQWATWEAAKTSPTRRLREFLSETDQRLPIDAWTLRLAMNAFRHRYSFLRLKCSTESGATRKIRLWTIWRLEETN